MNDLIFDSSSIISIALNNLLDELAELKKSSKSQFVIVPSVRKEIIDHPLTSKKFKLEAITINSMFKDVFTQLDKPEIGKKGLELQNLANSIFIADGRPLKIVDLGEMESLAAAILTNSTHVVDERTTRLLIENPDNLKKILENKFHIPIQVNQGNLGKFTSQAKGVSVIRSSELMAIAYEKGMFEKYRSNGKIKDFNHELLDGILWGLKLSGCAISSDEIVELEKLEKK